MSNGDKGITGLLVALLLITGAIFGAIRYIDWGNSPGRYQALSHGQDIYLIDTKTGEAWVRNYGLWVPSVSPLKTKPTLKNDFNRIKP